MKIKVFYAEPDGSIKIGKQQLEALLNEAYNEGFNDGKKYGTITWTYPSNTPYYTNTPYITTTGQTITTSSSEPIEPPFTIKYQDIVDGYINFLKTDVNTSNNATTLNVSI